MSDVKTFYFGNEGNNSSLNALLPLLQQRGIDPAYLYGLMGNNGWLGGNGIEGIIGLIVVLALIGGFNGNGNGLFGGNGNNNRDNYAYDALLSAIQRNGTDISQLAQTVGVSNDRIHDAIGQVSTQICNLAGQNGMSFQQVINSILSGNAQLSNQLAQCCCSIEKSILESNYLTERGFCNTNQTLAKGFSDIGYAFRDQTCNIEKAISGSTAQLTARLDAMEKTSLLEKIDKLREDKSTLTTQLNLEHQNNYTAGVVAQSVAPINAALADLSKRLADIECNQPEVAKIPYIPASGNYIPVSYSVPMHFGTNYNNCGYNYGC